MTTARHLFHLLRGSWFRRLFAVRVSSQFADGVFQVALASYVIFSPERQPSPAAIAGAMATVLLPFSVLGPFVGVFLDRWSRRQILAVSNFVRVALVLVLAAGVAADLGGPLLFGLILACLSVNRFLLAGLSAALPHVVDHEDLVMANAVTPTSGTLAAILGLGVASVSRVVWDRLGVDSDVAVLVMAALLYAVAGALALRIPRDLLGPDYDPTRPAVREAARHVARGLVEGLRHLADRRTAAYGLATIGAHRFFFGLSTVMLILLYRGYFHDPSEPDAAFSGLAVAVVVSGAGFVTAAFVTPFVTERVSLRLWVLSLLAAAAFTQVVPGALFTEPALLVSSYFLGLASQGIKICVDTLVQDSVDDAFRGRVFSLYDVIFNVAFVAAAAVAAVVLPDDGKSYVVLGVVASGYLLTGVGYALVSRPRTVAGAPV
ncbi:MFS transporter [Nocardioides sp. WL0053]|uniref:MFS transporter n=1 Tax=Nocardioides jiangsuensis TaxID=2866161 RepID=A0ABS7RHA1_9ACTN|nr:MFS transporter [Nocardioides jiangsuensis]MBY9074156.1 MFS transporter [Nocardioides jiangsuensis]